LISISKTFPVNFHQHTKNSRPHASIPPRPCHGIRRHGRRAVLSRCNSTRRNHLVIIGQALLVPCAGSRQCRMQRCAALRRATRSASASAESGAVSKPKPQQRHPRHPRHPGQLGPGPGPQQQQPNRELHTKNAPLRAP
jgi:hypothetical protein